MAKQKVLLVGDYLTTGIWRQQLLAKGLECQCEDSIVEALDYLKDEKDPSVHLLVQDGGYEIVPTEPQKRSYLGVFEKSDPNLGITFIDYVRNQNLIAAESPAFLTTASDKKMSAEEMQEHGIAKVIPYGESCKDLVRAMGIQTSFKYLGRLDPGKINEAPGHNHTAGIK